MKKTTFIVFSLVSLALLMAACSSDSEEPPTLTPVPTIAATAVPTFAIIPTETPTPTITPTLPPSPTPIPTDPLAVLNGRLSGGAVSVRQNPGNLNPVQQIVNGIAPVRAFSRTEDANWIQVEFEDGLVGWVPAADVSLNIDMTLLAVSGTVTNADFLATVKEDAAGLRLRREANTSSTVIANLESGQLLAVEGRLRNGQWVLVTTLGGSSGWVATAFLDFETEVDSVPIVGADTIPDNSEFDGEVILEGDGLRVRQQPGLGGEVVANLDAYTPVNILGRTTDASWLQIRTVDGTEGWVWGGYLRVTIDVSALPVITDTVIEAPSGGNTSGNTGGQPSAPDTSAYPPPGNVVSNVTGTATQLYIKGQSLGNRANVFSKVGDSLTATPYMFGPIGWNSYSLADFGYLQPVISYFQGANARDGNSFVNGSFAARPGWTTRSVLDPNLAEGGICNPGETPLECEYRVVKPSIALIMMGTNDMALVPLDEYYANMTRITQISVDMGVIPVLSTLPHRLLDTPEDVLAGYNGAIVQIARQFDVPIWDLYSATTNLPNRGVSDDLVHLSSPPPGDYNLAADFRASYLQYGYVVRNLTALQVLDTLWRQVLGG